MTDGTHRALPAAETWSRIAGLLPVTGVTRVAELTGLDVIGIPVYQAVRPNARTLSVSQGKGITPMLARVSAAMEAVEFWHAEEMAAPSVVATVAEVTSDLRYEVSDLPQVPRSVLSPATRLGWIAARELNGGGPTWVPDAFVRMDATREGRCHPPMFATTSNGLASGNTVEEALLHAMYELLERQAQVLSAADREGLAVDLSTVTGPSRALLDLFCEAEVQVLINDLSDPVDMPCYEASIWSRAMPLQFQGWGCHQDPDVALCRALTEAAQSRLTLIAGVRDDIADGVQSWMTSRPVLRDPFATANREATRAFPRSSSPRAATSFTEDLEATLRAVEKHATGTVCWVDLTQAELEVPVVKVVAPGLNFPRGHG
ncbi:YcaO-like family protein [Microbispora sp. NEAU-D428]|uniref:YcaO-like family protein n=1 Tax=Microbispora sitophila TaxID=2771537 RepID=UPI001867641D|nr:YcaO-like family protein [Microbispora sitophila]MBE3014620.1 YcaO-like family protein [Microbispora sitophila]